MNTTNAQQRAKADDFAKKWAGKGYEKGESQQFWMSLLQQIFSIESPEDIITFEEQVKLDHTSFIDALIPSTHVLIEQKSIGKNLRAPIKQSDGTMLTPFQQAKRYAAELPFSQRPRWIVVCNFAEFDVYDMEHPTGEPERILLQNLATEYYRLQFLIDTGDENIRREVEVSIKAGKLVGLLYDAILKQYHDPQSAHSLRSLNMLCVRLVFCLYAEDAGIFGKHSQFGQYIKSVPVHDVRRALIDLFKVLDTKVEDRDPYLLNSLAAFPYVNGGLFADEDIEIPNFNDEIVGLLVRNASSDFDWSQISPTIFGAVFESTLNPVTRRTGGMHYTSIQNIHKVIDPLFLDSLKAEFEQIKEIKVEKRRNTSLLNFQTKLASLTFLDPACGSGNFLTETYIALRRLENDIIKEMRSDTQISMGGDYSPIKVNINQFYGIEVNDFAVTVARTALWIAESQMMNETEGIVECDLNFLPLKNNANIVEGNALQLDWEYLTVMQQSITTIVAKRTNLYTTNLAESTAVGEPVVHFNEIDLYTDELRLKPSAPSTPQPTHYDYIMGNPPFVGGMMMSKEQKNEMNLVFGKTKGVGELDYVSAWYKKAVDFIKKSDTHVAFVSTNSITQGQQAVTLWKPIFNEGIHIDFAYRTFRWDSESTMKAHVHCVIVGFSHCPTMLKIIFDETGSAKESKNINSYLVDAENIFVESRSTPLCDTPAMFFGSMPRDGGNLILTEEEMNNLIKDNPEAKKWIHLYLGAEEFINNKKRYCLWLVNANPSEIKKCTSVYNRVQNVKLFRESSVAAATRKFALIPTLFCQIAQPTEGNYLIVPQVSSEKRRYIPMGFLSYEVIASNLVQIIPNATLYHFGILTSNVHMAWMRAVCGRLKSDYRYSKDIVYNNFPWPAPTDEQKSQIEQTAQAILDARALYPDSSLADLYDEVTMPPELRRAHQQNDRAVMQAYNFEPKITESGCVALLFKLYQIQLNTSK